MPAAESMRYSFSPGVAENTKQLTGRFEFSEADKSAFDDAVAATRQDPTARRRQAERANALASLELFERAHEANLLNRAATAALVAAARESVALHQGADPALTLASGDLSSSTDAGQSSASEEDKPLSSMADGLAAMYDDQVEHLKRVTKREAMVNKMCEDSLAMLNAKRAEAEEAMAEADTERPPWMTQFRVADLGPSQARANCAELGRQLQQLRSDAAKQNPDRHGEWTSPPQLVTAHWPSEYVILVNSIILAHRDLSDKKAGAAKRDRYA